jgi:hypothetical protein
MTGHASNMSRTLSEMTEQVLHSVGITLDDPAREHWQEYALRELRAAHARGELMIDQFHRANAPVCLTRH